MPDTEETLEKVYEPKAVETRWRALWEEHGLGTADAASEKPPFTMVIPPPNITGALHVGHALNLTIQDILARYKRMKGFSVLWLPGIDHAGIATQNVVERELAKEGIDRHKLGREKFLEKVWEWKERYGSTILNQQKRLGASCDWTRLRFTMDDGLSKAVREVFTKLYKEGLIYRGNYIVNWCPRCHTALSDIEVQFEETDGKLYYMVYPVVDSDVSEGGVKSLTVATTRPETMLGDTAVAVNPTDERYKDLIGKKIKLPLTGREIPIVADEHVSAEFGTGAVKITPAHDFNDFEIAGRHSLESINILDINAVLNENAHKYEGLDRYAGRKKIVEDLDAMGLLEKIEPHKIMIGECYRCSTVVEPRLSKQWFVKVGPLAGPAIEAVENGSTVFVPKSWEKTYFEWMRNIRDWCISRQIWWGHRIPAWHCEECAHITLPDGATDPVLCDGCGSDKIAQDSDVLDTWFSSALWPFSTLGWPDTTEDLAKYYPTSVLSTSFDIIFFWVARMMMMGLKFKGEVPFKEVYIHALIRDFEGKKMSKSKGNVIDPLIMMDEYGTDALRFTLAAFAAQGRDIKLAEERIAGYRNFCNKLWNLARFTLMNVDESSEEAGTGTDGISLADKWILTKFKSCTATVESAFDAYQFDAAAKSLYSFVWHELCDWYVELIKPDLWGDNGEERKAKTAGVLLIVLRDTLKLLHPIMPFITEEIYANLPVEKHGRGLHEEEFPTGFGHWPEEEAELDSIMEVIGAIRNLRTENNVKPGASVESTCQIDGAAARETLQRGAEYIERLARVSAFTVGPTGERPSESVSIVVSGGPEVFISLKGLIDVEAETKKIEGEIAKESVERKVIEGKLSNDSFVGKAPEAVVAKVRARLVEVNEKIEKLENGLERIKGMAR
jgi:valyl-tRNA synthetase